MRLGAEEKTTTCEAVNAGRAPFSASLLLLFSLLYLVAAFLSIEIFTYLSVLLSNCLYINFFVCVYMIISVYLMIFCLSVYISILLAYLYVCSFDVLLSVCLYLYGCQDDFMYVYLFTQISNQLPSYLSTHLSAYQSPISFFLSTRLLACLSISLHDHLPIVLFIIYLSTYLCFPICSSLAFLPPCLGYHEAEYTADFSCINASSESKRDTTFQLIRKICIIYPRIFTHMHSLFRYIHVCTQFIHESRCKVIHQKCRSNDGIKCRGKSFGNSKAE